ncbi:chromosome partitioning protein ParB [Mastigocladus laminosus UU774]|nr:chromosome partitioning protein ParB [Mastigocladus laminosus UU774]
MIDFYLVDVRNITSDIPRSNFSESDLENLADMILESGGIIRPLILKPTGLETYSVVDGHLEYYGAVRAREKNPRKGEMVNSLVTSPKIEDLVLQQVRFLKKSESAAKAVTPISNTAALESRLANLEIRIDKQINELRSEQTEEKHRIDDKFKEFTKLIPQQIQPLEAFNTLSIAELALRLTNVGFVSTTAAKIAEVIDRERKKKEFSSLSDVVTRVKVKNGKRLVKAISAERMLDIVDIWSRTLYLK